MQLQPVLAHNLLIQGELMRLGRGLRAAGIDFIVLKGVVLLKRIYGRLDARPVSDNDLLVREADVERCLAALSELGYSPIPQAALDDALRADAKYILARPQFGRTLWLDLHASPLVPTIHRSSEALFWNQKHSFELEGVSLPVLSPEATLLHLIAHAEQHRFCEARILRDVAAAWNTWRSPGASEPFDEGKFLGLAAQARLHHAVDYVLGSADRLGLLTVPPPFIGSPRAERLRRLLPPERLLESAPRNSAQSYWRSVVSWVLRDPQMVAAQVQNDFLPPLSKLAVIHNQPPSPLLYLRYVTRPFRPWARLLGWQAPPPASASASSSHSNSSARP